MVQPDVRRLKILALTGLLIAALPARAAAEWQFAPFIGWTFHTDTTLVDPATARDETHWTFGGAVSWIGGGPFGLEGLFVYTPGFFGGGTGIVEGSRTLALMGNVVLTAPRSWNEYGLRPFASGGIGLLQASSDDDILFFDQNFLGFNVGGGAVGFLTDRAGLRFDLRYFRHLKPFEPDEGVAIGDVRLSYWAATVGVVLKY